MLQSKGVKDTTIVVGTHCGRMLKPGKARGLEVHGEGVPPEEADEESMNTRTKRATDVPTTATVLRLVRSSIGILSALSSANSSVTKKSIASLNYRADGAASASLRVQLLLSQNDDKSECAMMLVADNDIIGGHLHSDCSSQATNDE